MKFTNLDNAFLYLTSICLLSIMVLQLLFRRKQGDLIAGRLLLGYFLSYLYLIGITYLFVYGEGAMFAHTLRTGYIAILLMPPLAFFSCDNAWIPSRGLGKIPYTSCLC